MKRFLKWIARTVGSAITIVLVFVLLPHASRLVDQLLPSLDGAAINASVTLKREMESSARLETLKVEEEGVLNSTTSAAFIGEVQSVTVKYTYTASIGIDLSKVTISTEGNVMTIALPQPEILSDNLHPDEILRDDFWYPLTDERRQQLLDEEQARCRSYYLDDYMSGDEMWKHTVDAFDSTISTWLGNGRNGITIQYVQQPSAVPLG